MSRAAEIQTKSSSSAAAARQSGQSSFWGNDSAEATAQKPFIQPKLTIGAPDDHFEREADSVADRAVQHLSENRSAPASDQTPGAEAAPAIQRVPISRVQRVVSAGEPEEKIQPKEEDEPSPGQERVQRKPIFESAGDPSDDGNGIQRKPKTGADWGRVQLKSDDGGNGESTASPDFSSQLGSSKGGGSPLPADTQASMGEAIGADFSGVRVHSDSSAAQMSDGIGAQAFTHGSDVYFNEGKYDPGSSGGQRLLAHELAHTVQQGGADLARMEKNQSNPSIKDATDDQIESANKGALKKAAHKGRIIKDKGALTLLLINFKAKEYVKKDDEKWLEKPILLNDFSKKRKTEQLPKWKKTLLGSPFNLRDKINAMAGENQSQGKVFTMRLKNNNTKASGDEEFIGTGVSGTISQLVDQAIVPFWDRFGAPGFFQIEHMIDWQILGNGETVDRIENLILLDAKRNSLEGSNIYDELNSHVTALTKYYREIFEEFPNSQRNQEFVKFKINNFEGNSAIDIEKKLWHDEHSLVESLEKFVVITDYKIPPGHFALKSGAKAASIFLPYQNLVNHKIGGWLLTINVDKQNNELISLSLIADKNNKSKALKEDSTEQVTTTPTAFKKTATDFYELQDSYLKNRFGALRKELAVAKLSPIEWEEPDLSGFDLKTTGKVLPTISLFQGADIKIMLDNGDFILLGEIPLAQFANNFPKPFKVDALDLIIEASSARGLSVGGGLDFSVGNFGSGSLSATVGKSVKFDGQFNFTNKYFNPAQVKFTYADGKWSIGGRIGIPEGKIKGIKSANLEVNYKEGVFSAAGQAFLTVPGVSAINLAAQFDEKGDFKFVAEAALGNLPGVKSGTVTVIVSSKEGGDIRLGMGGTAIPNLPAVPSLSPKLTVFYDDGIFLLQAEAKYEKGRVKGLLEVGITNRAVDDKGKPTGEPKPGGETVIFGFGQLTVDLLKGNTGNATLGVRLTPTGEVLVSGQLSLRQIRPFGDGKHFRKELEPKINISIPLIGIPGLSVYLAIGGGPYFQFDWDPLVLKELTVSFPETNIDQLESAALAIKGSVGSMARAEAGVYVKATLGAQLLIAKAEASLIGSAGLALEAEAGGDIAADWSFEKGLVMKEINAKLSITPKAVISLKGQIRVYLDLWLTTIDLYEKTWVLAEGAADLSGFSLNIGFPIRFDENGNVKPPEDMNDLQVEQPDLGGEDGDKILDSVINADAKREREAKKMELRGKIHYDMRQSVNDAEFSPSAYAKKMASKYKDDAEMRQFIMDAVEDEARLLEYEEFDALKNQLRFAAAPVPAKMAIVRVFAFFRQRIKPEDVALFEAELYAIERQKQLEKMLAQQAVALAAAAVATQKQQAAKPAKGPKNAQKQPPVSQKTSPKQIQRTPGDQPKKPAAAPTDEPPGMDVQAIVQEKFPKLNLDPAQVGQFSEVFKLLKQAEKQDELAAQALKNLNQGEHQTHRGKAVLLRGEAGAKKRIDLEMKDLLADDFLFPTDRENISHREMAFRQALYTSLLGASASLRLLTFPDGRFAGIELFLGQTVTGSDGGKITFDIMLRRSQILALDYQQIILGELVEVSNELLQMSRDLGEYLFLTGKKLGETFGHAWNSNVEFGQEVSLRSGHYKDIQGWGEVFQVISKVDGAKAVVVSPQGFIHVYRLDLNSFDLGSPFGDDYGYLLAKGIAVPFESVEDVYANHNLLLEKGAWGEGRGWRTEYDMNKLEQFAVGAFFGDYFEDSNGTMVFGQIIGGLIPIVGQIGDVRDITAGIVKMWETGGKDGRLQTALAFVGLIPFGDLLKAEAKVGKAAGKTVAEIGNEFFESEAKKITRELAGKIVRDPDGVAAAFKISREEAAQLTKSLDEKLAKSLDEGGDIAADYALEMTTHFETLGKNAGQLVAFAGGKWKDIATALSKSADGAMLGKRMQDWREAQFVRLEREVSEAMPVGIDTAKLKPTGTPSYTSDFDASFMGTQAALHKNLAERIMAERFGADWRKILDADIFIDPTRIHKFAGLDAKLAKGIEKKMVKESEINLLAKMLNQGKSLEEVQKLAKEMGADMEKVTFRQAELKLLTDYGMARRQVEGELEKLQKDLQKAASPEQKALVSQEIAANQGELAKWNSLPKISPGRLQAELEMDSLHQRFEAATTPANKAFYAEKMAEQQGKLNAAVEGPYFTPGGVAGNVSLREPSLRHSAGLKSLSPSMGYMSVLDDFYMLDDVLSAFHKTGLDGKTAKSFAKYSERLMRTAGQHGIDFSQKSLRKTWDEITDLLAIKRAELGKIDQELAERVSAQADELFKSARAELESQLSVFLKTVQENSAAYLKTATAEEKKSWGKMLQTIARSLSILARAKIRTDDFDQPTE